DFAGAMREVTTKRGQQMVLDLGDGSRVILAAASRLRIPSNFAALDTDHSRVRRELYLEGEAFFRVKHDPARLFIVRTPTAVTEDLGTEFVVSTYRRAHATEVAVESGSVALRRGRRGPGGSSSGRVQTDAPLITLTKGQVARVDSGGTATLVQNA